ncbi:MAG: hypothetical protein U0795_15580 [Pirellulales bacterium]
MSADSGERLDGARENVAALPKIVEISVKNTDFQAVRLRNFEPSIKSNANAVEFIVKTDGPIPVCGRGPVLHVGAVRLGEVTEIGPNTYRFISNAPERIAEDASIQLGWSGVTPAPLKENSPFRYRKP